MVDIELKGTFQCPSCVFTSKLELLEKEEKYVDWDMMIITCPACGEKQPFRII
jgi:Zn finger protein HypA/HybF involved in hydrogenase expression